MFRKIFRRTLRPLAVRYRRFMQAEIVHEIVHHRQTEANSYARSLEAALLTIALHMDETQPPISKTSQSDAA